MVAAHLAGLLFAPVCDYVMERTIGMLCFVIAPRLYFTLGVIT